jgi:hypothetical protein
MLRISWPLAFLLASVIAIIARKPRLFVPILIVFVIWFMVQRVQMVRRQGRKQGPLGRR